MSIVQDGVTPLMYAVKQGDLEMTKILITNGQADAKITEKVSIMVIAIILQGCR